MLLISTKTKKIIFRQDFKQFKNFTVPLSAKQTAPRTISAKLKTIIVTTATFTLLHHQTLTNITTWKICVRKKVSSVLIWKFTVKSARGESIDRGRDASRRVSSLYQDIPAWGRENYWKAAPNWGAHSINSWRRRYKSCSLSPR